jgi:[ribosomal protein S18]-alanine N-acetyltransferase
MDYSLHPACPQDLQTILPWVETADLLRQWGGPSLVHAGTPEEVWFAMGATPENAFSLFDPSGEIIGFGQAFVRDPSVHLARLIVAPGRRGEGLGRKLAMKLIQAAIVHYPDEITLKAESDKPTVAKLFNSFNFAAMTVIQSAEFFQNPQPA